MENRVMGLQGVPGVISVLLLLSCGPLEQPLPATQGGGSAPRFISLDPPAAEDGVHLVSRFQWALPALAQLEDLRLFEGLLSEYHARALGRGKLPASLAERERRVVSWAASPAQGAANTAAELDEVVVTAAPAMALLPGADYSWAVLGSGPMLAFQVSAETPNLLRRIWPPRGVGFSGTAVYCVDADSSGDDWRRERSAALGWVFQPGSLRMREQLGVVLSGLADDHCLTLRDEVGVTRGALVPPVSAAGFLIESTPLERLPPGVWDTLRCEAPWLRIGPGCLSIHDERFLVRSPLGVWLWVFKGENVEQFFVAQGGETLEVRGLRPASANQIQFYALSETGAASEGRILMHTTKIQDHVIINEVLANPLGAEPEQEWVELYNDGSGSVDLVGWSLHDSTGVSTLGAYQLRPQTYVVVATEAYQGQAAQLESGLLRVPSLGRAGLSNSGERLELRNAEGHVASRFPARAATRDGVSIARRHPGSHDDDESAFAQHGPPGASPGAANTVAPESSGAAPNAGARPAAP